MTNQMYWDISRIFTVNEMDALPCCKYRPQRSDNDTVSRIYASFIQASHIAETDQTARGFQAGRVPCLVVPFNNFIPSCLAGVFDSRAYIVFMSIIGFVFDDTEDFRIVIATYSWAF